MAAEISRTSVIFHLSIQVLLSNLVAASVSEIATIVVRADQQHAPTCDELLKRNHAHQSVINRISMIDSVEMLPLPQLSGDELIYHLYFETRIKSDGNSIELTGFGVSRRNENDVLPNTRLEYNLRFASQFSVEQHRTNPNSPDTYVVNSSSGIPNDILFDTRFGFMINGSIYGSDHNSIQQLLALDDNCAVELLEDGQYCLSSVTKYGNVLAWLDPAQSFCLTRYRIVKEADDYFDEKRVSEIERQPGQLPLDRVVIAMEEVQFEQHLDGFHIIDALVSISLIDTAGKTSGIIYHVRRRDIKPEATLNLDDLGTFIPPGAFVERADTPGIAYRFVDGSITPYIDLDRIASVDRVIESYLQGSGSISEPVESTHSLKSDDPYCGLYCVYAASRINGSNPEFEPLVKAEFIGSKEGSSFGELVSAAASIGLRAKPVAGLSTFDLKNADNPYMLHVKFSRSSASEDHYILLLKSTKDYLEVLEPPNGWQDGRIVRLSYAALLMRWSGNAIVLDDPNSGIALVGTAKRRIILFALFTFVGIVALRRLRVSNPVILRCNMTTRTIALQGLFIAGTVAILSLAYTVV